MIVARSVAFDSISSENKNTVIIGIKVVQTWAPVKGEESLSDKAADET